MCSTGGVNAIIVPFFSSGGGDAEELAGQGFALLEG